MVTQGFVVLVTDGLAGQQSNRHARKHRHHEPVSGFFQMESGPRFRA